MPSRLVGDEVAEQVRALSLRIYEEGRAYAAERGIIVADTKFEFGLLDGPRDSDRRMPDAGQFALLAGGSSIALGISPPSFDKQFVRDYLETLDWDKSPPAPSLPQEVIRQTSEKYAEALARITGQPLDE